MSALTSAQATVIAAILSAVVAIVVGLINSRAQRAHFSEELRDRDIEREKADAVRNAKIEMWMQRVDKKLDQHNGYAERFSEIGEDIAVIKTELKNLMKE